MSIPIEQKESDFLITLMEFATRPHIIVSPPTGEDRELLNFLYALIDERLKPKPIEHKLKTLEEHNSQRRAAYDLSSSSFGKPRPNGIECPNCKTELQDSNPSTTLASNPPQKNTHCPSCNYTGYRVC